MNKLDLSNPSSRVIPDLIRQQAQAIPDDPFLLSDDVSYTFAEADQQSDQLAGGLHALHVSAGDRVAYLLDNRCETVILALATNKLMASWVPICSDYKGDWLLDALARSRAKVLITQAKYLERVIGMMDQLPETQLVVMDDTDALPPEALAYQTLLNPTAFTPDWSAANYGDTCAIVWTSGTTGKSKGVMVSHNGWLRPIVKGSSLLYQSQPGDIVFNVLPLFHAAAWNTSIFRALAEGLPVVIEPGFSVQNFWQRVAKFKATQTFTLGAMHLFLWHAPESESDTDNTLRNMQAVPMPTELAAPFEKRFGVELTGSGYGQSECMLITSEAGRVGPHPPNSMGKFLDDAEVKVFNDQDQEVPPGEIGEMRIFEHEKHIICNGYFDDPQATAAAWRGDWFCTGDLGRVDEQGYFYFVDRKKDAVRFAGRNISTLQVEAITRGHPAVKDVAAYGIPVAELVAEDELKIDVVLEADVQCTFEEIAKFLNDNAPHYFVPRYMNIVDSLPYTPTNKIQKYQLREAGINEQTWDRIASGFQLQR